MPPLTIDQALQTALQHHQAGQLSQAEAIYRQILTQQPNQGDALHLLGVIAAQTQRFDLAVGLIRQAIALQPNWPEAHRNLALALSSSGQLDEAIPAWRQAVALKPDWPEAHGGLGDALRDKGQFDEAIAAYRQAVALNPNWPEAHNSLGVVLRNTERPDEAAAAYRQAIALRPAYAEAHNNLANALRDTGQLDDAVAAYRQAIALKGDWPQVHSNLVYALHFHPAYDTRAIAREHRLWNTRHAEPLRSIQPHGNDRNPDRRLRIGYVSGDFRRHVVAWAIEPVLAHHDAAAFEVFCYSNVRNDDEVTRRLQSYGHHWRPIADLDDARAAELVRADAIDILIDLAAHTANNRLLLFARKPAPVQASHLAYPASTGLSAIDFRITDNFLDPLGADESTSSETLVRLPRCWYCYIRPPDPPVQPLPALTHGQITFGSLNNLAKNSPPAIELWCRILRALPAARLLIGPGLHAQPAGGGQGERRLREQFARQGVADDRVQFVGRTDTAGYMRLYHDIDVALDPFPCNGGNVTCDALWMGVPVVTLRGQTSMGRAGVSILSAIGLTELIADTPEDYVKIAVNLAQDAPRLQSLRPAMRPRMQASPLTDAVGYTRDLEAAYRRMWRQRCPTAP